MKKTNSYISSAKMKEKGRTAYYKMLESVRQGELVCKSDEDCMPTLTNFQLA